MPDITMCHGEGCELKNKCYRFRAIPSEFRQSYFRGSPILLRERCGYFHSIEGWTQLAPMKEVEIQDE